MMETIHPLSASLRMNESPGSFSRAGDERTNEAALVSVAWQFGRSVLVGRRIDVEKGAEKAAEKVAMHYKYVKSPSSY